MFSNLSDAEVERLALVSEECGEIVQLVGKIFRHGFESYNPYDESKTTNRDLLTRELADLEATILLLLYNMDIDDEEICRYTTDKIERVGEYLHHNFVPSSKDLYTSLANRRTIHRIIQMTDVANTVAASVTSAANTVANTVSSVATASTDTTKLVASVDTVVSDAAVRADSVFNSVKATVVKDYEAVETEVVGFWTKVKNVFVENPYTIGGVAVVLALIVAWAKFH